MRAAESGSDKSASNRHGRRRLALPSAAFSAVVTLVLTAGSRWPACCIRDVCWRGS
ncbi:hypothetical protein ACFQU9_43425 [Actinomadura namibiensis]|uniref:Uncharacterized protein n=1 Tax=Actinomadura namibiensis TaxID=182080 RepID=A0A7W3LTN8_ACTNM|nr:hypothetical protein [Actinomadura namibiensis]MBA8954121.1 hypothetical protein [Actinomadura namibiensis]